MPIIDVFDINNERVGDLALSDAVFAVPLRPHLVHEVVTAQLHSRRAGTACTKTRGELSYSTRKPYSQKKTGRARAGSRRSPLWRGGGTIFGPKPRDLGWRPPSRVRREALKIVLTAKVLESKLTILQDWPMEAVKTKTFVETAKKLGLAKALIVVPKLERNLLLSCRNVPGLDVILDEGLNCYDVLRHDRLVILEGSVSRVENRLQK